VALAIFLASAMRDKEATRSEVADRFGHGLARTVDEVRPGYYPDASCQGTVPEAIVASPDATLRIPCATLSLGGTVTRWHALQVRWRKHAVAPCRLYQTGSRAA